MIVSRLASLTAIIESFYLEQLSSCRHVQHSAGGVVRCSLHDGAQSRQNRRLPHGFARFQAHLVQKKKSKTRVEGSLTKVEQDFRSVYRLRLKCS